MADSREKTDLTTGEWDEWIAEVAGRLGVDPATVNVPLIHDLTREIAHRFQRPMAPVGAYLMGLALGAALGEDPGADAGALLDSYAAAIDATLPEA